MVKSLKWFVIPLLIILGVVLGWLFIFVFSFLEPNPPTPTETYGEFPFKLEYSIDEEIFVVEDVVICEYDGVKWNEGTGKYRAWRKILKKTGEEDLLILTDEDIKIYCTVGSAEYYMNDLKYSSNEIYTPAFYYVSSDGSGSAEELLNKYKIELIDWRLSDPIENSFG